MKKLIDFIREARSNGFTTVREIPYHFSEGYQDLKAIFYSAGARNEVFAFIGVPQTAAPAGGFPSVVLIHGGDGCAYYEWVREWTNRGYLAIAPDFSAQYADGADRHAFNPNGGPRGYGSIDDFDSACPWLYFSVLSAMCAADVLYAHPQADRSAIFAQGISWGGFISLAFAAFEKRIKALSVIYSSAFISDSLWGRKRGLGALSAGALAAYNRTIDPQTYLKDIAVPVLFSAGTDDGAFTVYNRRRTAAKIPGRKAFSYRLNFQHGHAAGWSQPESAAFFRSVQTGQGVPSIAAVQRGAYAFAEADPAFAALSFIFTREDIRKKDICMWEERSAAAGKSVSLAGISAYFFTGKTSEGLVFSTDVFCTETASDGENGNGG